MTTKVIWWGTGYVGKLGLKALLAHPDYELAGLISTTPEKVGKDAGEILGVGATGIIASDDIDAVLSSDADTVAYFATSDNRLEHSTADMARCLRAGKNVVSNSGSILIWPETAPDELVSMLEDACKEGGTSFFMTGVEPGVFSDLVPMTFFGICARVDRVRVSEFLDYSTFYNQNFIKRQGWGGPMDEVPMWLEPGRLTAKRACLYVMAAALGKKIEKVNEFHERQAANRRIVLPRGMGVIEEGTQAALHWYIEAIIDGEPKITIEHYNRMAGDQAPDWPTSSLGDAYRLEIEGSPSITADFAPRGEDGDQNTGACLIGAWRAVSAIPTVRAAAPGIVTPLDIPLLHGSGNMY